MEYKILNEDSPTELEAVVNAHIQQGYEPWGGVTVVDYISMNSYMQVMIKRENGSGG